MAGSQAWSQAGKEEHADGEQEQQAAQAKGYTKGVADRLGGYKDSIVGAVSGDKSQQAAGKCCRWRFLSRVLMIATGNAKNEKGQAQQEVNKPTRD